MAAAATGAWRLSFLHDEGVLVHDWARAFAESPLAVFFFVKAKPALAVLYALPARLGLRATLVAHATLAALAIPAVTAAARSLGARAPALAGWTVATSAGFLVAAGAGFSNGDGALFLSLFLWAYLSERRLAAGLLLGVLPLVRNELAAASVLFALHDLWRRRDLRFAVVALSLPVVYAAAGAFYHHDAAWLLTTLPDPTHKPEELLGYVRPDWGAMAWYLPRSLFVNGGVLGLAAVLAWRSGDRRVRSLAGVTVAMLVLLTLFQRWGIFGFDLALRYHVPFVPLVAVLAAVGASTPRRGGAAGAARLAAIAAAAAWAGVLLAGGEGRAQHARVHELAARLRTSPAWRGQPLFTDVHVARYDECAGLGEAHMVANDSIAWELDRFLNRRNGQREALVRALAGQRFHLDAAGSGVDRGAIYLLADEPRSLGWRRRVEAEGAVRERLDGYWLYHWRDPGAGAAGPTPGDPAPRAR